ncbi:MAG: hypothetical protein AAGF12_29135 [Myxococcota bacterium]
MLALSSSRWPRRTILERLVRDAGCPIPIGALAAMLLLGGCTAVTDFDGYCALEPSAPDGATCRLSGESCGCAEGLSCQLQQDVVTRVCGAPGVGGPGEPCNPSGNDCAAQHFCIPFNGPSAGICVAYCQDDSDCAGHGSRSACALLDNVGSGLCLEPCHPTLDPCANGIACLRSNSGNGFCRFTGPVGVAEPCQDSSSASGVEAECQANLSCEVNAGLTQSCFAVCGPGLPLCSPDQACVVIDGQGNIERFAEGEYGVCAIIV